MLIPTMFERSVERTPDCNALVDPHTDRRYPYRDLAEAVYSTANSLRELNVDRGDRVALLLKNHPEHVIASLATQVAGGVAVPFNFRSAKGTINYLVRDTEPTVLFFDEANREAIEELSGEFPFDEFIYIGADAPAFTHPFTSLQDGLTEKPAVTLTPDDFSVILYTSGTTGRPKGIPIDHLNSSLRAIDTAIAQGSYLNMDTTVSVMPLYHTIGLHSNCLARLALSGTFIPMAEFDPDRYLEVIEKEAVTVVFTAPTILNQLVNCEGIESANLDSVRVLGYGGEPIGENLAARVAELFEPERMINIYGNTESYHPLGLSHPVHSRRNGLFYRTKIVELNAKDPSAIVETGTEGELIIDTAGPITFDGYWEAPEETAEAIVDGWFFTGDAAYETAAGLTVITGRADDTIISGGENIHPGEIEDVLRSHPTVTDIGVVGAPDDTWGEVVMAFVQATDTVTKAELDRWCLADDSLDDFKRPREYVFVEEIPRNPSGKVMRYKLREQV